MKVSLCNLRLWGMALFVLTMSTSCTLGKASDSKTENNVPDTVVVVKHDTVVVAPDPEQQAKTYQKQSSKRHARIQDGVYRICPLGNLNFSIDNDANRFVAGNNVHLWENNDSPAQKWYVENRQGGVVFHSGGNWNLLLDNDANRTENHNNIMIWDTNYCPAQIWFLDPVPGHSGVYVIRNSGNPEYCINLPNGNTSNGNNIELYKYCGGDNQKWVFIRQN